MNTVLITLLSAVAVAMMLVLLYRRGRLERLPALTGEIDLCEERAISVDENRIRYYRYGSCLVRLTDRRLIIAQKAPFLKDAYYVRFVIEHGAREPGIDIGGMLMRGYVPARVSSKQVSLVPEGTAVSVAIKLVHANGNRYSDLSFRSERAGEYARAFPAQ